MEDGTVVVVIMVIANLLPLVLLAILIPYSLRQSRRNKERQAAERAADAVRQRNIAEAAAARQLAIDRLAASGKIRKKPERAIVTCSNRHRYMLRDFVIEDSYVETDYEQHSERVYTDHGSYLKSWEVPNVYSSTSKRFGCPLCKSTLAEFEDERLRGLEPCARCGWWSRNARAFCPVCQLDGKIRVFSESALPAATSPLPPAAGSSAKMEDPAAQELLDEALAYEKGASPAANREALELYRSFVDRYPLHTRAEEVKQTIERLESVSGKRG